MKLVTIFLINFSFLSLTGQIRGDYAFIHLHGIGNYSFLDDNTFKFVNDHGYNATIGGGQFEIKNDTLLLNWKEQDKPIEKDFPKPIVESNREVSLEKTLQIEVVALDSETNISIPFTSVSIFNNTTNEEIMTYETGIDGMAEFKIENNITSISISISATEYESRITNIEVDSFNIFKIKSFVVLKDLVSYSPGGRVDELLIIKNNSRILKLRPVGGSENQDFIWARVKKSWKPKKASKIYQRYFSEFYLIE